MRTGIVVGHACRRLVDGIVVWIVPVLEANDINSEVVKHEVGYLTYLVVVCHPWAIPCKRATETNHLLLDIGNIYRDRHTVCLRGRIGRRLRRWIVATAAREKHPGHEQTGHQSTRH